MPDRDPYYSAEFAHDATAWREEKDRENRTSPPPSPKPQKIDGVVLVNSSEVVMRPIDWLWSGRLALGKLTIFSGPSELGKSTVATDLAARVSNPDFNWPDGDPCTTGQIIIVSSEDGVEDTIVPRLTAAGADLRNVHILKAIREGKDRRTLNLATDMARLGAKIDELAFVKLVIFDPITAYLGAKIDSHQAVPVRAVLEPLQDAAERHQFAGLLIAHPQKAAQFDALNVVSGSAAFVHIPRLSFIVIKDPEGERTLFLPGKNNIGVKAKGLGYFIESAFVGEDDAILTSRISWSEEPVNMTANEALARTAAKQRASAGDEAEDFIREKTKGEGVSADDLWEEARARGIAEQTLKRAAKRMGVRPTKQGYQGKWWWKHEP